MSGRALAFAVGLMNDWIERMAALPMASIHVSIAPLTAVMLNLLAFTLFTWLRFRRRIYSYWSVLLLGLTITSQIHQ